jgi:aminoglycoside phosphotransferase (APT) family kinase protein
MAEPEIGERLQRRFPELVIEPLTVLDIGFGSTVVETPGGIIFRIARHERAARGQARELVLLPQLHERLPVAVPKPEWRVEPGDDFAFGAIGYRKLGGTPLEPGEESEQLARDVAAFLRGLHDLRDVDGPAAPEDLEELDGATRAPLRGLLQTTEFERLERWWDDLRSDESLSQFEPVLRHGDLWHENLLVADGRLVGVLDWGAAAVGDPAEDFAPLRHVSEAFAEAVLDAYEANESLRRRERRRWEIRELYGVRLALTLDDAEELTDAVRKLRAGPVLARRGGG